MRQLLIASFGLVLMSALVGCHCFRACTGCATDCGGCETCSAPLLQPSEPPRRMPGVEQTAAFEEESEFVEVDSY